MSKYRVTYEFQGREDRFYRIVKTMEKHQVKDYVDALEQTITYTYYAILEDNSFPSSN